MQLPFESQQSISHQAFDGVNDFYDPNNPNGWADEALGYNCAPLKPENLYSPVKARIKTLPPHHISVANHEALGVPHSITFGNEIYQEVGFRDLVWSKGGAAFLFPGTVLLLILIVRVVYYDFFSKIGSTIDNDVIGLILISVVLVLLCCLCVYCPYQLAFNVPSNISIRFCRRNKKVYMCAGKKSKLFNRGMIVGKPHIEEIDWENCRAEIYRIHVGKRRDIFYVLVLVVLNQYTKQVIDRVPMMPMRNGSLQHTIFDWEFLRRYMQDELTTIPCVKQSFKQPKGLLEGLDRLNPLRLLLSEHVALTALDGKTLTNTPKLWIKIVKIFDLPIYAVCWILTPLFIYGGCMRYLSLRFSPIVDWSKLNQTVFRPEMGSYAQAQMLEMQLEAEKFEKGNQARNKTRAIWFAIWLGSYMIPWVLLFMGYDFGLSTHNSRN